MPIKNFITCTVCCLNREMKRAREKAKKKSKKNFFTLKSWMVDEYAKQFIVSCQWKRFVFVCKSIYFILFLLAHLCLNRASCAPEQIDSDKKQTRKREILKSARNRELVNDFDKREFFFALFRRISTLVMR